VFTLKLSHAPICMSIHRVHPEAKSRSDLGSNMCSQCPYSTVKLVDVAGGQFNELQGDKLEFANTCEAGFDLPRFMLATSFISSSTLVC